MTFFGHLCDPYAGIRSPDGQTSICQVCGSVVEIPNPMRDIQRMHEIGLRDYGSGRRHSMRCIHTQKENGQLEWCCADDCSLKPAK